MEIEFVGEEESKEEKRPVQETSGMKIELVKPDDDEPFFSERDWETGKRLLTGAPKTETSVAPVPKPSQVQSTPQFSREDTGPYGNLWDIDPTQHGEVATGPQTVAPRQVTPQPQGKPEGPMSRAARQIDYGQAAPQSESSFFKSGWTGTPTGDVPAIQEPEAGGYAPTQRPPGIYAGTKGNLIAKITEGAIPFMRQIKGEVPWRDPETPMEGAAWIAYSELIGEVSRPITEALDGWLARLANKDRRLVVQTVDEIASRANAQGQAIQDWTRARAEADAKVRIQRNPGEDAEKIMAEARTGAKKDAEILIKQAEERGEILSKGQIKNLGNTKGRLARMDSELKEREIALRSKGEGETPKPEAKEEVPIEEAKPAVETTKPEAGEEAGAVPTAEAPKEEVLQPVPGSEVGEKPSTTPLPEAKVSEKGQPVSEEGVKTEPLKPAVVDEEKGVIPGAEGETHPDIIKRHDLDPAEDKRGFVDPQGNFLDRKEAAAWVEKNQPAIYDAWRKLVGPDSTELYSEHYNQARKEASDAVETRVEQPDNIIQREGVGGEVQKQRIDRDEPSEKQEGGGEAGRSDRVGEKEGVEEKVKEPWMMTKAEFEKAVADGTQKIKEPSTKPTKGKPRKKASEFAEERPNPISWVRSKGGIKLTDVNADRPELGRKGGKGPVGLLTKDGRGEDVLAQEWNWEVGDNLSTDEFNEMLVDHVRGGPQAREAKAKTERQALRMEERLAEEEYKRWVDAGSPTDPDSDEMKALTNDLDREIMELNDGIKAQDPTDDVEADERAAIQALENEASAEEPAQEPAEVKSALSPTKKGETLLPGMKVGLEMPKKGIGEGGRGSLDKTELGKAALRAEQDKSQGKLFSIEEKGKEAEDDTTPGSEKRDSLFRRREEVGQSEVQGVLEERIGEKFNPEDVRIPKNLTPRQRELRNLIHSLGFDVVFFDGIGTADVDGFIVPERLGRIYVNTNADNADKIFLHEIVHTQAISHPWAYIALQSKLKDEFRNFDEFQEILNKPYRQRGIPLPERSRAEDELIARLATGEAFRYVKNPANVKAALQEFFDKARVPEPLRQDLGKAQFLLKDNVASFHRKAVEKALREGKPVPKEVLADYPDLKPPEPKESPKPEAPEPRTTGIKKAVKTEEREARGLEEVESEVKRVIPAFEEGKRLVDSGQVDPRILASELVNKSRPISDVEAAALLHDAMRIRNDHVTVMNLIEDAMKKGDKAAETDYRIRLAKIEDDMNTNDIASKRGGTEWSATGRMYQQMIAEDYSLARVLQRARVANGGAEIPAEMRQKIEALTKNLAEANEKLRKYDEEASQRAAQKEIQKIKNEDVIIRSIAKARARKVAAKAELDTEFGSLVKALNRTLSGLHFVFDPESIKVLALIARNRVMAGVVSADGIVSEIHDQLKADYPDITKRDIRDAISGYGKTVELSKEDIEIQLRDLRRQMRLISAFEDATAGKVPLRSGLQRDKPTDEVRELGRKVKQAMREAGIDSINAKSPEEQWKTSIEAVKTRLRNHIADLQKQIETGEKTPKKVGIEYDEEAKALKAERDRLKDIIVSIEGKPEMSPEQRIRMATSAVEKSIVEYERRIKEKDLAPKPKGTTTPETPELKALRQRRDDLKDTYKAMQDEAKPKLTPEEIALKTFKTRTTNRITELEGRLASQDYEKKSKRTLTLDPEAMKLKANVERLKGLVEDDIRRIKLANRTKLEKSMDYLAKWRRAVLLSSVRTVVKLTAAAVMRQVSTPIEELIGGVLAHIPGVSSILEKAPREGGGFNVRAEAKAFSQWFSRQTYRDMRDVLKAGRGELDLLYGGKGDYSPEALDFFGHVHGALKTPVKRAEFFRSLEKRSAWAIKNGMDITDPQVQMTLGAASYLDAERAIFMNDNTLNTAYRMLLRYVESKGTAGKIAATAMKVELPIVKVPTNIVSEAANYAFGGPKGTAQVIYTLLAKDALKDLTGEQADNIGRSLKKGLMGIGVALLAIAYYKTHFGGYYQQGEKRGKSDLKPGEVKVLGISIPHFLLHHPAIEILHMGATIKRVEESYRKQMKGSGTAAGAIAATKGMVEQVPFLEEPSRMAKALKDSESAKKFGAELGTSLVVPPDVTNIARMTDTDKKGETVKRRPETATDVVKMAIPGLRKQVPAVPEPKKEPTKSERVALQDMAKRLKIEDLARRMVNATSHQKSIVRPILEERMERAVENGKITREQRRRYLKIMRGE